MASLNRNTWLLSPEYAQWRDKALRNELRVLPMQGRYALILRRTALDFCSEQLESSTREVKHLARVAGADLYVFSPDGISRMACPQSRIRSLRMQALRKCERRLSEDVNARRFPLRVHSSRLNVYR